MTNTFCIRSHIHKTYKVKFVEFFCNFKSQNVLNLNPLNYFIMLISLKIGYDYYINHKLMLYSKKSPLKSNWKLRKS